MGYYRVGVGESGSGREIGRGRESGVWREIGGGGGGGREGDQ